MQELVQLTWVLAEAFRCHVHHFQCLTVPVELAHWKSCTWHRKASAKNSSKLNKFLHSEVNQLIQHIIVKDQDGQNNNNNNNNGILRISILLIGKSNQCTPKVYKTNKNSWTFFRKPFFPDRNSWGWEEWLPKNISEFYGVKMYAQTQFTTYEFCWASLWFSGIKLKLLLLSFIC